jgi:hypothetical protein
VVRAIILVAAIFALASASIAQCEPKADETKWLDGTVRVWRSVRADSLKLAPARLPWLILFDEKCVYNINPDVKFADQQDKTDRSYRVLGGERVAIYSTEHLGKIKLPDGQTIPAQLISFAANYDGDKRSYLAAALPSIWAKAEHLKAEQNLKTLVRSVYVHELTHTYHRNFFARLSVIEKGLKDVENFDDDIIQNTLGKNDQFRNAYLDEIALAVKAGQEPDRVKKRLAAKLVLTAIKHRRAQFYVDDNEKFAEIEDIFLTMEGVANWAAYRASIVDGMTPENASRLIRRSGKYWSQEEGILLFLIIDQLLPNWQKIAFGKQRVSIVDLLERATR